jgi:hypothetical protein
MKLSDDQFAVLYSVYRKGPINLLTLRRDYQVDPVKFAQTIHFLTNENLIERDELKAQITRQGVERIAQHSINHDGSKKKLNQTSYIDSVSATRITTADFYLPNAEKFLSDINKRKLSSKNRI